MKTLLLLALGAFISVSCTRPGSLANDRKAGLSLPKRYDTTSAPSPDLTSGLLARFADATLRAHVKRALARNPDLKEAASRLAELGYDFQSTKAPLFPNLKADGNFTRRKFANLGFGGANQSIPASNSYDFSLDANWEVDVWGRIRAGVSAAASDLQAARADYASARQSIAAQTMQTYMEMAGLEERLKLNRSRLASFERTLNLVDGLFVDGTSDLSDVNLARTDVERVRSEQHRLQDERDQSARRLRTLTGDYVNARLRTNGLPRLGSAVPAGLPSSLLMRRPDIDAAYQLLRAADSRITVAHRALFPAFTLTATGGRSAPTLKELANSNFTTWNILSGFSAPIFENGRLRNELGAATKRAEQAYHRYQKTVLNAFREVEDALGLDHALASQEKATQAALDAARSAEDGTRLNYEAGLVEILTLLEAQRRRFDTEEELIQLKILRRKNRITLALALAKGL